MIWRLEYENAHGDVARLDIQKGDATPVEIIEGTENPFLLSYELEDKSKKGFIMSSFADISIYETDTFNIDDLKTLDETALSVKWYINNVLEWTGFVVPDFFSRTIGEPGIVNLAASDRLSALKDATLDGLDEYISLRGLAVECLAKTGLSLPLAYTVDFKAGTTNIMDAFALSARLEDDKGKKISCYDVLRSILVLTNSTIRQRKGLWRIYNKIQHEALTPTLNFDEVYQGAKRTIQPVFSSVGAFQEFGGTKSYPNNYMLSNSAAGWVAENGFITEFDNRELNYTPYYAPSFGDETNKINLINRNIYTSGSFDNQKKLSSPPFKVPFRGADSVAFTLEINARGIPGQMLRYVLVKRVDGVPVSFLRNDGTWTPRPSFLYSFFPSYEEEEPISGGVVVGVDAIATIKSDVYLEESEDPDKVTLTLHILGVTAIAPQGENPIIFASAIRSAKVVFAEKSDAKGILYRTDQLGDFSKKNDPETTIFGDFISSGLNGYFYPYSKDESSILHSPLGSNPPLSKWTTATDPAAGELPILQHVTRQMSRMFGVAHNIISAVIDAKTFDPLAIVTNCAGEKYVIVAATFDFLRSTVEVELQQIAYGSLQRRDFIFSYFGGGDGDGISSIGSVSGGGSSGGSGGGIPQTLDLLADELFISGGNSVNLGVYARKTWVETEATAFNSTRLGGQLANQYPRRDVDEVITGKWSFNNNTTLRGDRNTLALYYNTDGVAKSRVNEIILGREDDFHKWRILNQSTSKWGNAPNLSFQHLGETGSSYRDVLSMTYGRYVGIGIASPTEKLHVVGNGLFTGSITAQGNLDVTGISTFRDRIGTNAFVSGFTGDGTWRLQTGDETHLTVDRLTVRGRMDVYELVINQIRATNGSLWVTDAMKTTGVTNVGSTSFRFAFDNDNGNRGCTFVVGDIVKAQRFTGRGVVVFVGRVLSVTANNFTLVTVGYMPDYTGDLETLAGLEFVRIGNISNANRQGSLYLTSSDSGSPYMDVLDGVNSASLAGKTKVRLGKLDGISDSELGDLTGYGLYAENAYLKGEIVAKSGVIGGWDITTDRIRKPLVNGGHFDLRATSQPQIEVSVDGSIQNRILMFHYSPTSWGLLGDAGGKRVFWLGSTNQIAGIRFNHSRLFTDKWWIDKDGSFSLGNGKITGTAAGNVTIDGSLITQHITAQSIEGLDLNFTKGTIGGFDINTDSIGKEGSSSDLFLSNNRFYLRESSSIEFDVRKSTPCVVEIRDHFYRTLAKVGMRIRISGSTTLNRALETYGEVLFMSDNGVYGIRINDDGIKKTTNSGKSWSSI